MGLALVGSPLAIPAGKRILVVGDSETDEILTSTQVLGMTKQRYLVACQNAGVQANWCNLAVSASHSNQQLAVLQSAFARFKPDYLLWVYGTAPLLDADPIGTPTDNVNTTILGCFRMALDACASTGVTPYVATVNCLGEKFPDGSNPSDATINTLISGLATIAAAHPACAFRDMRAALYTIQEPLLNTLNTTMGPLCSSDATGVHYGPGGRALAEQIFAGDVTFTTNAGALLGYVPYSLITPPGTGSLGAWFDPASSSGVGGGGNVLTWANTSGLGLVPDFTITPGAKPTWVAPVGGAGMLARSAIAFAGGAFLRTTAFTNQPQPMLTAIVWKNTAIAANQIIYDGNTGLQEPSLATIAGTGVVEANATNPVDNPGITAGTWRAAICFWPNNLAGNYTILDGSMCPLGNSGTSGRSKLTIGISAGGALPWTGSCGGFWEWYSSAGSLPKWQDVQGFLRAFAGPTPQ